MEYIVNPTEFLMPDIVSFDTEYTELNIRNASLLSVSIGVSPDLTYIFDIDNLSTVLKILNNAKILFTWNMVVDWYMLGKSGIVLRKDKIIDAMLLEHLIDENLDHGLGDFALREYQDDYKKDFWSSYKTYQEAPKEVAYEYEMRDGIYTYIAGKNYLEALKEKMELVRHVHRLQWALFDTEIEGIKIDVELLRKTKMEMGELISGYLPKLRKGFDSLCASWEMEKWRKELHKRKSEDGKAGVRRPTYSFSSDPQIKWLVYEALKCQVTETTKKGSPKTDVETLKKLSGDYPLLQPLVDYKEIKGTYATFVKGILDRVEENRIYPHFSVNGTTTGRISHSNPNMGNLPTEGVYRNFFLPDDGHVLVGADYSQLEVVVEANLTEDPSLLKIILEGASKHDITAQGLGISRESAKTLNFALQYGAGVYKISKMLSVSNRDAQDVFNRYWELYSGVKALKDLVSKQLADSRRVTNIFGRSRNFQTPRDKFDGFRQERQAYNFLIQGPGSDMMNMATYTAAGLLKHRGLGRILFSVHDELVTEVKENLLEESQAAIVEAMEVPNDFLKLKYRVANKLYGPLSAWSKG